MNRTRKVLLTVVVSIIALLWFADEYPYLRFHGDGNFSGGPVLGYQIKMRPIPFNRAGEYVFHFRGILNEDMSLQLYRERNSNQDREELPHLDPTLDALLWTKTDMLSARPRECRETVKMNI